MATQIQFRRLAAQRPLERDLIRIRFQSKIISVKIDDKAFQHFNENANEFRNGENSFKRDTNQQTSLATCSSVWENAGTSVPKWESGKSNQSCRSRGGGETEGKALIIESTLNQFNVTFYSESKSSIWRVGSTLCLQPNQLLLTRARFLLWNVVKIFPPKKKTQHFDSSRKLVCQMSRLLNGEGGCSPCCLAFWIGRWCV